MAQSFRRISTSPGIGPVDRISTLPPTGGEADPFYRAVPRLLQSKGQLAHAPLDHRQGFVLSLVDGKTSVQALIDLAGIAEQEVVGMLQRLRSLGIITLG